MSLHYLLDGYNILKRQAAFNNLPLEEGRRAFLRWIDITRPQGSIKNQVTVVFDGNPDNFGGSGSQGDIRVIFSQHGSADDEIKRMVEEDRDAKNCIVVSDDKEIFIYARRIGARAMSVAEFTKTAVSSKFKGKSAANSKNSDGKYISLSRQEKITQEFFKIWLGEKQ